LKDRLSNEGGAYNDLKHELSKF